MASRNHLVLDRVFVASRTDVIGDLVPVKLNRPEAFKTKNAKGSAASAESFEQIIEIGRKDAAHFSASLKKDPFK